MRLQDLTIRDVRHAVITEIVATVQMVAIAMFVLSIPMLYIGEDMRVPWELVLTGICAVSAFVLLANGKREETGTALWLCAISLFLVACDVAGPFCKILALTFGFAALWLMCYVAPLSATPHDDATPAQ